MKNTNEPTLLASVRFIVQQIDDIIQADSPEKASPGSKIYNLVTRYPEHFVQPEYVLPYYCRLRARHFSVLAHEIKVNCNIDPKTFGKLAYDSNDFMELADNLTAVILENFYLEQANPPDDDTAAWERYSKLNDWIYNHIVLHFLAQTFDTNIRFNIEL